MDDYEIYQNPPKKLQQKLDQKVEDHISAGKVFKCDTCSKSFKTSSTSSLHLPSIHDVKKIEQ